MKENCFTGKAVQVNINSTNFQLEFHTGSFLELTIVYRTGYESDIVGFIL